MPQRRRGGVLSPYSRGYSPQIKEAVEHMPIPNECCVCKQHRPQFQYSNNQLNYLRQAIFDSGYDVVHKQLVAKCLPCTNGQKCEEMCFRCKHIRGIDQFARNQRIRDNPICQPCMKYEQSLNYNNPDGVLALTDKAEGAEDEAEKNEPTSGSVPGSNLGSLRQLEWHNTTGLDQSPEKALVLDDGSVEKDGKRKAGGFAKVKAHYPKPEPAPGWTPGNRTIDDRTPLEEKPFI
ncbi:uncharacterized protein N7515_005428 [Penicillium bovifimosum]|uniref:Stc1 domain-containing protein n=1 Tax=Penicillium bovifimosum TaxID=126998 RepID=A0A9W9GSQ3_9EURO|nr:uncharacterized protein N7515_005428 [Penicillium bovifimosum]KAJ5129389.1 hypothetical protein N7515_005428 [Penicillium bovifimosum]